jgi:hypothetical protein
MQLVTVEVWARRILPSDAAPAVPARNDTINDVAVKRIAKRRIAASPRAFAKASA